MIGKADTVPTLNSVNPSVGAPGATISVVLAGTNFVAGATVAVSNPGIIVGTVNVLAPKAKVVFVGACGIDKAFTDQWHLQDGQALIVPDYKVPGEFLHIDLNKVAWEWQSILITLADGKSVAEAVNVGNDSAAALGAAHRWQFIGDGNVNFRASKQ
jgi:hypothetical protein